MEVLSSCHQSAAIGNENVSSVAVRLSASVDCPFQASVASAILTLGDIHGPTAMTRWMLYSAEPDVLDQFIKTAHRVPGWGNSFHKAGIDPLFVPIAELIQEEYPDHYTNLGNVGDLIEKHRGKRLMPNAASFTAICSQILGMDEGTEISLVIAMRIPSWAALWTEQKSELKQ